MDTIFKTIITGIASIFLLAGSFAVILGVMDITRSSDYLESVSAVIVESNYNADVIEECRQEAEGYGYKLEVTVYGGAVPGTSKYADIRLTYTFEVPLIGYSTQKSRQKVL